MRGVVIALIFLVLGSLFGLSISNDHHNTIVEQYCSVANSHDVKEYKACKDLSQTELIVKLTKGFENKNSIPVLEEIK